MASLWISLVLIPTGNLGLCDDFHLDSIYGCLDVYSFSSSPWPLLIFREGWPCQQLTLPLFSQFS